MKRSYLIPLLVFVGNAVLLLTTTLPSVAASFSGRVVDEAGIPVSGVTVAFPPQSTETDETGAFSITNIATSSVNTLMLLPVHRAECQVPPTKVGGLLES